jgi:hypothetical protein
LEHPVHTDGPSGVHLLCPHCGVSSIHERAKLESAQGKARVRLMALFNCGRSGAVAPLLEGADAHWFNPHCHCGWTGDVIGAVAVKHWVQPWHRDMPLGDAPGSCDSGPELKS